MLLTWSCTRSLLFFFFCVFRVRLGGMGSIFATDGFGLSIGYPLTLNGAFLVNLCLTFFVYREIKGRRNTILFLVAGVINIVSVVLLSLAKQ